VDDEATIVKLQGKIRERLGCAVTPRTAGPEALAAIRADSNGFDLVITDLSMPKKTGGNWTGECAASGRSCR
jgi:CheY-like chemotaxis protein